jgi:hypothetical protein
MEPQIPDDSADITQEEQAFLEKNRLQSFRVYHARTLASALQLIKSNKKEDAIKYLHDEIYNITQIKNKEFSNLMDALTLKLVLRNSKK